MVWSATSSMKVSGTLVTGMLRAVAAAMSTLSAPTLPSAIILQFSRPSMMASDILLPRVMSASQTFACSINSPSLEASISTISASIVERYCISGSYAPAPSAYVTSEGFWIATLNLANVRFLS